MNPRPLNFAQLIKRLTSLGAFIQTLPSCEGEAFLIWEQSIGYYGQGGGRTCPFTVRPDDEPIPVIRIESVLDHLGFDPSAFWDFDEHALPAR